MICARAEKIIARAIALDPEIVYFDEPSSGLDPITAAEVDNLICKLNKVFGITMVVVTHDLIRDKQLTEEYRYQKLLAKITRDFSVLGGQG